MRRWENEEVERKGIKRWMEPRVKEPHAGESPEAPLRRAISSAHGKLAQAVGQAWT